LIGKNPEVNGIRLSSPECEEKGKKGEEEKKKERKRKK
jgi:hypothetical protein